MSYLGSCENCKKNLEERLEFERALLRVRRLITGSIHSTGDILEFLKTALAERDRYRKTLARIAIMGCRGVHSGPCADCTQIGMAAPQFALRILRDDGLTDPEIYELTRDQGY